ncbi:MAG TPA: selenoneine biosynthesis selenosugar synthase SenB [Burkholderiales bacterium]|nr:selenoneine biosynthesis selenosugar synthase SenB [Burkholderiales bacterium]
MRISLITPVPSRSRSGNRNTAARWNTFLRELGHKVVLEQRWSGVPVDLMIALHARRSHDSIRRFAEAFPERPLVVVLTGTDLYRDIGNDADAQASLAIATRLIVLHELGARALPAPFRAKTRVIVQSARAVRRPPPLATSFEIIVSGHLRPEKDPFRAATALSLLPAQSRVRVTHIGGALSDDMADEARMRMAREPRYRWLGELPHGAALRMLARSRLLVVSSIMEGGANVVCEALANRVPVLASRIDGNVGMLGPRYPGYFTVADERALARLMLRAERDGAYYQTLVRACAARRGLVEARRERAGLRKVIAELAVRRTARVRAAA